MARYTGASCRLSRRERTDLQLKSGIRSIESKCRHEKTPGQHWQRRGRTTDYGLQLRMKQLLKRYYGVLERQFRKYYEEADRRKGSTGEHLLRLLESRLDNVVYRMGFASTRAEARQIVLHCAVLVNGQRINIPSYSVKPNDVITIREQARGHLRIRAAIDLAQQRTMVSWVDVDGQAFEGRFKDYPDVKELPAEFKVNLVVELYSK